MSYLQKMVDGGKAIENGSKAMHIKVPYSLAAEAAKKADALDGYKAERVKTYWQEETAWQLITPSDHTFIVEDTDVSEFAVLAREIVQSIGHELPQ